MDHLIEARNHLENACRALENGDYVAADDLRAELANLDAQIAENAAL